jgi:SAM-dependent methyltransferase
MLNNLPLSFKEKPHIEAARKIWKSLLLPADTAIDATCGSGRDTAYLASLLSEGQVVAIDIQEEALRRTALLTGGMDNVRLLRGSHAQLPDIQGVKLVVYNLGYLPGGDKGITTLTLSTLQSLQEALRLVVPGGVISCTCYPGHPEGERETAAILAWSHQLPPSEAEVSVQVWGPRRPLLLVIKKII